MPLGNEIQPDSMEALSPRRSLIISTGIGTPEADLLKEISQQVNVTAGEVIDGVKQWEVDGIKSTDTMKEEEYFAAVKSRIGNYQHATLVLHAENNHGPQMARLGLLLGQTPDLQVDMIVVKGGYKDHVETPYIVSSIHRQQ